MQSDKDEKECTYDYTKYATGYKEESDWICLMKGCDFHNTHCCNCIVLFSNETVLGEACYIPSTVQPAYFCLGRNDLNTRMVCAMYVISRIRSVLVDNDEQERIIRK